MDNINLDLLEQELRDLIKERIEIEQQIKVYKRMIARRKNKDVGVVLPYVPTISKSN